MKRSTLETLLIDRELGELSSEASELLEAYLSANPDEAASARPLVSLLADSKQALALTAREVPQPAENVPWRKRSVEAQLRLLSFVLLAAACFGLGLFVGQGPWGAGKQDGKPDEGPESVALLRPGEAAAMAKTETKLLSISGHIRAMRERAESATPSRRGISPVLLDSNQRKIHHE